MKPLFLSRESDENISYGKVVMFINLYYTKLSNNGGFIMNISDNGFLKLDNSIIDYWMSRLNPLRV